MKKTAAKSTTAKTPAPATKATPDVVKTAAKKAVVGKAVVAKAAPVKAPVAAKPKKAALPVAPAVKAPKAKAAAKAKPAALVTTIIAAVDVGFGNNLTLRGEGPGLSWDAGIALDCVGDDRWSISLPESKHPIVCKFLVNDTQWCVGDDYTVLPGASVVLSPTF